MIYFLKHKNIGLIAFNICIVILLLMIFFRSANRDNLYTTDTRNIETTHISKVCIGGEWDECWDFPRGELVKIFFVKPNRDDENKILYINVVR